MYFNAILIDLREKEGRILALLTFMDINKLIKCDSFKS